jgi:hypothetical protein
MGYITKSFLFGSGRGCVTCGNFRKLYKSEYKSRIMFNISHRLHLFIIHGTPLAGGKNEWEVNSLMH